MKRERAEQSGAAVRIQSAKEALQPWAEKAIPLLALADFITSRDR